ncbi:MAG: N-acetylneuraminate synthase family protein [Phycisphaerales bacterium]
MIIGARSIGPGERPYVIAEIGVNHDGCVERALALVDAAAEAGADAIKTQWFRSDLLLSSAARLAMYQASAGERDPVAMLDRLCLGLDEMRAVVDHTRARGLHAVLTVFSPELIGESESLCVDAYKSASPDVVNKPLLDGLARTGRPLIVSTGAATLDEVRRCVDWLDGMRAARKLAMLHCVSAYPTPLGSASLDGIRALSALEPGVPVGYSDHTEGTETAGLAVAAGAVILEKHLTHDRAAQGPDHAASLEPDGFARYVRSAHEAHAMMGRGKGVLPVEEEVRMLSRQSLVAARDIAAGEVIAAGDLRIKRPGTGLAPWMIESVVGQRAARPITADQPLLTGDIAWRQASAA